MKRSNLELLRYLKCRGQVVLPSTIISVVEATRILECTSRVEWQGGRKGSSRDSTSVPSQSSLSMIQGSVTPQRLVKVDMCVGVSKVS